MMEKREAQEDELCKSVASGALHPVVIQVWQKTRIDWSLAGEGISDALRKHRLGSRERRYAVEVIYGMVRHLRRLDEALRLGGITQTASGRDRLRILTYLLLEGGLATSDAEAMAPDVDWSAVAGVDDTVRRDRNAVRRLAVGASLPDWLSKNVHRQHGEAAVELMAGLNQRAPLTVRVNRLRSDRSATLEALAAAEVSASPGRYGPDAISLDEGINVRSLDLYQRGDIEVQDEASQLVAELVGAQPGERVVDLCAGAGGKTLALAAAMGNKGRLIAADIDSRKLNRLRKRARRAGVTNVQTVVLPPDGHLPAALEALANSCDRVLVDAPCSAIGTLRRHPEVRWRLQQSELERYPRLQTSILERASTLLAPGGRLVYATCTVLDAENRAVVDAVGASTELASVPVSELLDSEVCDAEGAYLEMFPHRHGTDGFFAAVMRSTS